MKNLMESLINEMIGHYLSEDYEDNLIEEIMSELSEETIESIKEAILNELSPELLARYKEKSQEAKRKSTRFRKIQNNASKVAGGTDTKYGKMAKDSADLHDRDVKKREQGIKRASRSMAGKTPQEMKKRKDYRNISADEFEKKYHITKTEYEKKLKKD